MRTKRPKTRLLELLDDLGWERDRAVFSTTKLGQGRWAAEVVLDLPDRQRVGRGEGQGKANAEHAACDGVLAQLEPVDWETIKADAQPGDALFKLAGYLLCGEATADGRARWLRAHERDSVFARLFDARREAGDPDLQRFGPRLGVERKATMIEALFWYRHRDAVLQDDHLAALQALLDTT